MSKRKTRIIAEAGVNHNGSVERALALVDQAVQVGADYVKFQTFTADDLATKAAPKARYQKEITKASETQYTMLKRLELTKEEHKLIYERCIAKGIKFLSTPFDLKSLTFLVDDLNLPEIKLGSGDLTNAPLLLLAGRSGVKIILSTGMSTLSEVEEALGVIAFGICETRQPKSRSDFADILLDRSVWRVLFERVTLLHCTTEYPANAEDTNLMAMSTLRHAFGLSVGYSDHTEGEAVSLAAIALGATVLEKHFTLDRNLPGPDHAASLEPGQLQSLIQNIRMIESAIGDGIKQPCSAEIINRSAARKSIIAARDLPAGHIVTLDDMSIKRAGNGETPMRMWEFIGLKVKWPLREGDVFIHEFFL